MNAWIDCLTYIREGDGMSRYQLGPDETLVIQLQDSRDFRRQGAEIFEALVDAIAAVNRRQVASGEKPALQLLLL